MADGPGLPFMTSCASLCPKKMQGCKEHDSGHKKCNQHDRSGNISHTTYCFHLCS